MTTEEDAFAVSFRASDTCTAPALPAQLLAQVQVGIPRAFCKVDLWIAA